MSAACGGLTREGSAKIPAQPGPVGHELLDQCVYRHFGFGSQTFKLGANLTALYLAMLLVLIKYTE